MQIEIEGTITKVLELRTGTSSRTGNAWQRQDYVIETPGQYPRRCLFTVADGNIAMFNLQVGQRVRVTLSIDAHEYQVRRCRLPLSLRPLVMTMPFLGRSSKIPYS